ncbi:MAG: hypothetical protein A2Y53_03770 [Chloroflexi bacterium RBG_16_47_49]|nr:MAG: hypothetical protein A2Y53_03770 [Chloroflexi bacterium RBG_16_47_49]
MAKKGEVTNPATKVPKIRQEYEPKGVEADVLKFVYRRYGEIRDDPERSKIVANIDRWRRNWEALRAERDPDDWQSNYFIPLTTSIIEQLIAEMIDQNPRPIILPRSSDDKPKATVMRHIFDYSWEVADSDMELYDVIKDALTEGTGIAQEYYFKDRRIIRRPSGWEKNGKERKLTYENSDEVDYDDVYLESVRNNDFFIDPDARDVNRGPYRAKDCFRRYILDIDDFRTFFVGGAWDQLGNAKLVKPGAGDTDYWEYYRPPQGIDQGRQVEVLWYWGRKPEDALIVVANDVVIRMGPNPYNHKQLPFARAVDVRRTHNFYGKGESELLDSIQEELNTYRRQLMDRAHLDIDKMAFVSRNETLDERDLIARPHGMVPVEDPTSIRFAEYGDVPRSVEMLQDHLQADAVKVTGVEDRNQGLPTPSTATEAAILKESTLKRVKMKLRFLEKGFLVDVGRLRVANIIQFYSQPRLERIIGPENSDKYRSQIERLSLENKLVIDQGQFYRRSYRQLRLQDKMLFLDETGSVQEKPVKGISFFEATPDTFIPAARGGFDIRFEAGSTMPVSKPLMQAKITEMFDRLAPVAAQNVGYDIVKLGDAVLEANDLDPEDFHLEDQEPQDPLQGRNQKLVQLASQENEMVSRGEAIPPLGTPGSSPIHTEIHIAYLKSPKVEFTQTDMQAAQQFSQAVQGGGDVTAVISQVTRQSPAIQLLVHIMGEMMVQQARLGMHEQQMGRVTPGGGGGGMRPPAGGETGITSGQGNMGNEMRAVMPNRMQGGADVARGF